ncbi:MAG: LLM class flavin-dependent oxidoreductase, partial [Myxococcota bacterium]
SPLEKQPPILIGALREGMLKLAGRIGDGAILNWLSAKDVKTVTPYVHAGGPDKEIVARLFVIPIADREIARGIARRAIAAYLTVPVYAAFHEWLGRGEELKGLWTHWQAGDRKAALAAIPDEVVDDLVIHGSPGECREHIERYREAGIDTPVLAILHTEDLRQSVRDLAPQS